MLLLSLWLFNLFLTLDLAFLIKRILTLYFHYVGLESLSEREVSVDDNIFSLCLISLFGLENDHLSLDLRVRV